MDEFEQITAGVEIHMTYATLEVSQNAPEAIRPERTNKQWALISPEGKIVALGPATGGGKSDFIKYASANAGFRVAHRIVTSGEWKVPVD